MFLQFSKDDDFLYLTAGDGAKIKVFILAVAPTPLESTTHHDIFHSSTTHAKQSGFGPSNPFRPYPFQPVFLYHPE